MATKYPAPTNGIVRSPPGVAPGVGVLYVNGVPTKFVSLRTPLAPGMGVEYVNGKATRFVKPGGAGASATSAPAPSPPRPAFQLGADPGYLAAEAAARQQRDVTLGGLTQQRASGLGDYGYSEGAGGALTVDPNNPFSKAALLKQSYDRSRATSGQRMASAGQLYAGAFQNQQDLVNRGQLQSEDALQKSLIRFLAQNTQSAKQAQAGYGTTTSQAASDAAARFAANPPS